MVTNITPVNIKKLQRNSLKLKVYRVDNNLYRVESRTFKGSYRLVRIAKFRKEGRPHTQFHASCSCDWYRNGGECCTHILAAFRSYAEERGRLVSFWTDYVTARSQKHKIYQIGKSVWMTVRWKFRKLEPIKYVANVDGNFVGTPDEYWSVFYPTGERDEDGEILYEQIDFPNYEGVQQWSYDNPKYKIVLASLVGGHG